MTVVVEWGRSPPQSSVVLDGAPRAVTSSATVSVQIRHCLSATTQISDGDDDAGRRSFALT